MTRRKKHQQKPSLLIIIIILLLFAFSKYVEYSHSNDDDPNPILNSSENLNIYFLDVGQGDSILISNNNHNMLIDAGNNEDGPLIVSFLKNQGIKEFDYVVGTHPHEDHIGGLDDIINNFPIQNILLPDAYSTSKTFEDVLDAIENKQLEITVPEIDSTFSLGDARIKVIYTGTDLQNLNNSSIVLKLTYGKTSYLFTGDATNSVEKSILDKDIKADVLKVGHHGSSTSTSAAFLNKVNPRYAIISVGQNNTYNHPSDTIIKRLQDKKIAIYQTAELGTIQLSSDGQRITITNYQTKTNG